MSTPEPINLVLVYRPDFLDVEDFKKIAARVRAVAGNITVFICDDRTPDKALIDRLAADRTLVVSPAPLQAFIVNRGRVYAGRPMRKSEQLLRLQLAGVPVPAWAALDRGRRFDPSVWGEYVVVKPEIGSRANGVTIAKTRALNDCGANVGQYQRDRNTFIVQKLVANRVFGKTRILTLFGEVLFARRFRLPEEARFDTDRDMLNYQRFFLSDNGKAEDFDSADEFAMAKRCSETFDDVPLLALDVLHDEASHPFFIEANPGGNTWHFSSALAGRALRARGTFLERQFGAFDRAGDVLASRALNEAI
jgi:hypothetical protein